MCVCIINQHKLLSTTKLLFGISVTMLHNSLMLEICTISSNIIAGQSLGLAFFPPIFLSSNSFYSYLYFAQYLAHYQAIFLLIKVFLVYLQLLSILDCCIRVIHNMVTALLEYLDLLAVFPEAHVDIILFMTILVECLHLCNAQ